MIDPRNMTVTDWCDSMAINLGSFLATPILLNPLDWQEWARVVVATPAIAFFKPPNPDQFIDWREWAMRFNQAVQL